MHLMATELLTLHGSERSGSHMQRKLGTFYAASIDAGQHLRREVQSCRGCCHTAFDLRVDGLVGLHVALFCGTIEIWRNWQLTRGLQHLCPCHVGIIPVKLHYGLAASCRDTCGTQGELAVADADDALQRPLLPLLGIAHQTHPLTRLRLLEHKDIVAGLVGLKAEYLDERARLSFCSSLAEV